MLGEMCCWMQSWVVSGEGSQMVRVGGNDLALEQEQASRMGRKRRRGAAAPR